MARQDVPVGGVVYYGYSKEDTGDWSAGINELKKGMDANSVFVSTGTGAAANTIFEFGYYWMTTGNHVVKVSAADSTRGLPFTIYATGIGTAWAWIGSAANEDMGAPKWTGVTAGDFWTTGSSGVSSATEVSSLSIAKIPLTPTGTGSGNATAMYLIQDNSGPYVYPNNFSSGFTPFRTTISGVPTVTDANINVFGPIHASRLSGVTKSGIIAHMPTQTTQQMPPGDYSVSGALSGSDNLRAVMPNSDGYAMLFLNADTGTSTYDDE